MALSIIRQVTFMCSKAGVKVLLTAAVLIVVAHALTGCGTIGFYAQAIQGQYQLVSSRESIDKMLDGPGTSAELRQRLATVNEIRQFAENELALPVNGHYRGYVDVHRAFVVWNVQAAREFSLEPRKWWYPLVGKLDYRGYFKYSAATNYASTLEKSGWDVSVEGVQAYSTLGWFKDPVLNTFVFDPDPMLAELIFHELSHQEVFASGDTDFNEAFATTVGQEGTKRWLKARGDKDALGAYERALSHNAQFVHLVKQTRGELEELYGDERTKDGEVRATNRRGDVPPAQMRRNKAEVMERMMRRYRALKAGWADDASWDFSFGGRPNNANLNSIATYYDLVPGFEALLAATGGDMKSFYAEAKALAGMPRKQRREWLKTFGP